MLNRLRISARRIGLPRDRSYLGLGRWHSAIHRARGRCGHSKSNDLRGHLHIPPRCHEIGTRISKSKWKMIRVIAKLDKIPPIAPANSRKTDTPRSKPSGVKVFSLNGSSPILSKHRRVVRLSKDRFATFHQASNTHCEPNKHQRHFPGRKTRAT